MPPRGKTLCGGTVKQVTRSNFAEALGQLRDHVQEADFVAVSAQSTGSAFFRSFPASSSPPSYPRSELGAGQQISSWWRCISPIDTVDTAYLKAKAAAERFELLQLTVCPFRLQGSKVVGYPYSFHLFPRDEWNIGMPSYSFSCQMPFLTSMAQEGFDFNSCIYDGISYLSRVQESMTKEQNHIGRVAPIIPLSSSSVADAFFMEKIKLKIQKWRNLCENRTSEDALVRSLKKLMLGSQVYGSRPCINVDVCNNRQVQLVMLVLRQSFENLVPLIIPEEEGKPKQVKVVLTSSEDDRDILIREIQNLEEENERKLCGFREVIDMISSSHKPLISCQALNDLTFIHSKFVGPLPPSMAEFMCSLRLVFSTIIDLSYLLKEIGSLRNASNISTGIPFLRRQLLVQTDVGTSGQELARRGGQLTCREPAKLTSQSPLASLMFYHMNAFAFPVGKNVIKNHGYDVLKIANCFAKLSTLLKIDPICWHSTTPTRMNNTVFQKYANLFNHTCMVVRENEDLVIDDRKISATNPVFLWGFGVMSSGELKQKLYGTHDAFAEDFELKLIDNGCAILIFSKENTAQDFLRDIGSGSIHLESSSEMVSNELRVAGYEAYKKLCGLDVWGMDLADAFDKVSC